MTHNSEKGVTIISTLFIHPASLLVAMTMETDPKMTVWEPQFLVP